MNIQGVIMVASGPPGARGIQGTGVADLEPRIEANEQAITAEAQARSQEITQAVGAEATARGTAITDAVAAEAQLRTQGDADEAQARSQEITQAVGAEATARGTAITDAVAAEAQARSQEITQATTPIQEAVDLNTQAIDDLGVAQSTQGDKVTELERYADDIDRVILHWDTVAGSDANDGQSFATSVRTWERLCEIMIPGTSNEVNVYNDAIVDYFRNAYRHPTKLGFRGRGSNGTGFVARKMTFQDATNSTVRCGGMLINARIGLNFRDIDIEFDTSSNLDAFDLRGGTVVGKILTMTGSSIGTGAAALFGLNEGSTIDYELANYTLGTMAGHLFGNVAAGIDPNIYWNINTNITSG